MNAVPMRLKNVMANIARQRWLLSLTLGAIASTSTLLPAQAAEKLYFIYGPLNLSLRISSLEAFAKDGTINKDLGFYIGLAGVDDEKTAQFREALTAKKTEADAVLISRFFNTHIGEDILTRFGKLLAIQGGRNGKYALRGALVTAAFDEAGLSLLNFLRQLPTNIQIDVEQSFALSQEIELVVQATKEFSEHIAHFADQEAKQAAPVDFSQLKDLRQPGEYEIQQQTWNLTDARRERSFYVQVFSPGQPRLGKTPVVIISHGLASNPEGFEERAKHLASYGYVVALPQHPGSDFRKVEALRDGYSRDFLDVTDFIDRPLDISYVIDELERRNGREFDGKLDLKNVGVIGHSFGGYTALAIAGATIDFANLERDCNIQFGVINTSLLLQCRALDLERKAYQFRDERVVAAIAANPVNAAVFGEQGLDKVQIPVALAAGNYDPAAPLIFEQVDSFPSLSSSEKYLLVLEGQAHVDFSELDAGVTEVLESVDKVTLPSPQLINDYSDAALLAFCEVHVAKNEAFRPYLQSSYVNYLSQNQPFKAHGISAASSDALVQAIEQFKRDHADSKLVQASRNSAFQP